MKHVLHIFFALAAAFSTSAWAHKSSDAYLLLNQAAPQAPIQAKLAIALRDLDRVFDTLDANNDRALSFGEIKAAMPGMESWAVNGVKLRCGAVELSLPWRYEALEQRSDGVFVRLVATSSQPCDTQQAVSLRYTLMQSVDADHRSVMSFQWALGSEKAATQGSAAIKPSEAWSDIASYKSQGAEGVSQSALATLSSFIVLGIEHIGSGADHIAFIICLVLGLALRHWREWKSLLITVTAFTLGHSITLISATLGWVGSPSWVEPVIALSIAVAAAFNLVKARHAALQSPVFSAALAATFGLVHGLGFSGAMTEAQVPEGSLLWALAGFNIGVELGQLLIIAAWSLVYWALHRWAGYGRWVVRGGSVALIVLALYWFGQRLGWLA
jgi:hypothetical protein